MVAGQEMLVVGVNLSVADMRRMAHWGGHALSPAVARATALAAAAAELARLKELRKIKIVAKVRAAPPTLPLKPVAPQHSASSRALWMRMALLKCKGPRSEFLISTHCGMRRQRAKEDASASGASEGELHGVGRGQGAPAVAERVRQGMSLWWLTGRTSREVICLASQSLLIATQ